MVVFVININFEKKKFEHKIGELTHNIIKQKSDLYSYGWTVHQPLCEEIEDSSSYFLHFIITTITVNQKKERKRKRKKMSIKMIFQEFKQECEIKNVIMDYL